MIARAVHLKYALKALCLEDNLHSLDLRDCQWEDVNTIEKLLQKFDRATQLTGHTTCK